MCFGENVLNSARFENVANTGAGLDAGSRACGDQYDATAPEPADHAMGYRLSLHLDTLLAAHHFLSILDGLFHGGRHFIGFSVPAGYAPMLITDYHQRVEAEPTTTLHNGSAAPNLYDSLFQAVLPYLFFSCHALLLAAS
jgi:hypothetical protein